MKKTIPSLFLFFLIQSNAHAASQPEQSPLFLVAMVGVFVLLMYFTAWRPQSKRAKEHRELLNALSKGDEVVTTGGLLGKVNKVNDQFVELTLGDAVDVIVQRHSITTLLPKGTMKSFR